jgi:hypothetical protein
MYALPTRPASSTRDHGEVVVMRTMLGLTMLLACFAAVADAAVLCATKKGAVKLREACKPKETAIDPVALGLQGPKGDKGDSGAAGTPGVGLITLGQTVGNVPLGATLTVVAATNGADAPTALGGAWYGPITNPATTTVFQVTAHVVTNSATGTLECVLERSINGGGYVTIAIADSPFTELFLNDAFPAFVVGDTYNMRVSCLVFPGSRSATFADIGVVASVR